jgi:hypothetical protein
MLVMDVLSGALTAGSSAGRFFAYALLDGD